MQDSRARSCTFVNGSATEVVAASDRGLMYGDGLFETMVWRRPSVELQDLHFERLLKDCARLGIPLTESRLTQEWQLLMAHLNRSGVGDLGIIKIIVTRGTGARGYKLPTPVMPTVIISYGALDRDSYVNLRQQGASVRICDLRLAIQPALAGIKHLNRLEQVLARAEWDDATIAEGLMLDRDGFVIEATMSNVLCVKSGELYVPATDRCGVSGVMLKYVTETVAPSLGIKVHIGRLSLDEFCSADEWFLTNSIMRICPIVSLGAQQRRVGPVTTSLQETLDQLLYA